MSDRETLEQAADAGGILVHSWSLKDHAALVSAIRAVLESLDLQTGANANLFTENERLRAALADPGSHWCKELREENERLRAALDAALDKDEATRVLKHRIGELKARIDAALALHTLEPEWRDAEARARNYELHCLCGAHWNHDVGRCSCPMVKALKGES